MQISDVKISNHVITKKRSYADLDYKITEGFEISDFTEDFKISVKISKDFNQKRTRFQGVSSTSGLITARKLAKLFTEACTNKRGSLTSKTVQPTPAQIGSSSVTVRR